MIWENSVLAEKARAMDSVTERDDEGATLKGSASSHVSRPINRENLVGHVADNSVKRAKHSVVIDIGGETLLPALLTLLSQEPKAVSAAVFKGCVKNDDSFVIIFLDNDSSYALDETG